MYSRQMPIIGNECQKLIKRSRIAVAGLGGLGCNVITHTASAGVGEMILIDDQFIAESDLNRQFVYSRKDIGKKKTELSAQWIKRINPDTKITKMNVHIDDDSIKELSSCDLIVDCLDNYEARMAINRYAFSNNTKIVHGAVESMFGHVTVVIPNVTPCLECIIPNRVVKEVPSISPAVGLIGALQAAEVIKMLTGRFSPLSGKLLTVDVSDNSYNIADIKKNDMCACCSKKN